GSTVCQCRWFASVVVDSKVGKMPIPKATNFRIGTLVSCPRSSLPLAANVGDKQVTEIKELVSRFRPPLMSRNFGIGTLVSRCSLVRPQPAVRALHRAQGRQAC